MRRRTPTASLVAALGLLLGGPAHAAARLVVELADPVKVTVDGRPIVGAAGRVVVNHITPGPHRIEFRAPDGRVAHEVQVMVGAEGEVRGRYSLGSGLTLTGELASAQAAPSGPTTSPVVTAAPPPPDPTDTSSFDMNEGGRGGVGAGDGDKDNGPDMAAYRAQRAAATIGRGAVAVTAPTVAGTVAVGAVAVGGAAQLARSADAGGFNALRSSGPSARQGRPTPPEADKGQVTFRSLAAEPYQIYLEGFLIAEVGPQRPEARVTLEVGRHLLELWDADTATLRWKGVAQVTKDQVLPLEFSDAAAPRATERAWNWSGR